MGVPPGSRNTRTTRPAARNRSANNVMCVDLPLPSVPSNVMNRPFISPDAAGTKSTASPHADESDMEVVLKYAHRSSLRLAVARKEARACSRRDCAKRPFPVKENAARNGGRLDLHQQDGPHRQPHSIYDQNHFPAPHHLPAYPS